MNRAEDRILNMYSNHIKRTSSFRISHRNKIINGTHLQLTDHRKITCYYRDEIFLPHFKRRHTLNKPSISIYTGYQDQRNEKIYTGDILSVRINCSAISGLVYIKNIENVYMLVLHCGQEEYIAGLDFDPENCVHIHNPQLAAPIAQMFHDMCEPYLREIIDESLGCRPEIGLQIYQVS